MFNRKTLFIVGAGAGHEINLPVGRGLAQDIAGRTRVAIEYGRLAQSGTSDDDLALSFFERSDRRDHDYLAAFRLIQRGVLLANSIDDFLNIHEMSPAVIAVGKAAIVRAILFAERHSHIFVDQSNARNGLEIDRIHSTWLVKLMQVLGPDRKVADVERVFEDLSFIVFNYDRCIEHFLAYALQLLYGVEREVAEAIVGRADIIHPYGSVGDLDRVPFGGPGYGRPDYFTLGQGIKTYTEQVEENATLDKIAHSMERAECVVFLGFAYHKQNMRLLFRSHKRPRKMVQVYGTAFGMSDADKEHVVDELNAYFGEVETEPGAIARGLSNIHIENKLGCTQLFDYYAKSLAG